MSSYFNPYDSDILNSDLRSVHTWSDTWDMSFNLKKCKPLRITMKKNPVISATYQLGHNELSLSKEEKDLGVVITHNLSWREHIMSKVSTARMLGLIKRTCGKRPIPKVFLSLYIHLVKPHLDYACEVWSPQQAASKSSRYPGRSSTEGNKSRRQE